MGEGWPHALSERDGLSQEGPRDDRANPDDCHGSWLIYSGVQHELKLSELLIAHRPVTRLSPWSLRRPDVEVSILPLPTSDWLGHCHALTAATPRRLEPLGRHQAQHQPVRVLRRCGAKWLVACQVREAVKLEP